jgi:glycerophosphoryl diester phosphodiesterase
VTPSWLARVPIAHRGLLARGVPENSFESLGAALEAGFAVEFDVRPSRGGTPWLSHDAHLTRTCGIAERIDALDDDQLAAIRPFGSDHPLLRLTDALGMIEAADGYGLIEVKPVVRGRAQLLREVIRSVMGRDDVLLTSFDPITVSSLRRRTSVPVGQNLGIGQEFHAPALLRFALENPWYLPLVRPAFLSMNVDVYEPSRAREIASSRGLPLVFWTVRGKGDADRAAEAEANIIFEPWSEGDR